MVLCYYCILEMGLNLNLPSKLVFDARLLQLALEKNLGDREEE